MRVFVDIKDLSEDDLTEIIEELTPLKNGLDGNPLSENTKTFLKSLKDAKLSSELVNEAGFEEPKRLVDRRRHSNKHHTAFINQKFESASCLRDASLLRGEPMLSVIAQRCRSTTSTWEMLLCDSSSPSVTKEKFEELGDPGNMPNLEAEDCILTGSTCTSPPLSLSTSSPSVRVRKREPVLEKNGSVHSSKKRKKLCASTILSDHEMSPSTLEIPSPQHQEDNLKLDRFRRLHLSRAPSPSLSGTRTIDTEDSLSSGLGDSLSTNSQGSSDDDEDLNDTYSQDLSYYSGGRNSSVVTSVPSSSSMNSDPARRLSSTPITDSLHSGTPSNISTPSLQYPDDLRVSDDDDIIRRGCSRKKTRGNRGDRKLSPTKRQAYEVVEEGFINTNTSTHSLLACICNIRPENPEFQKNIGALKQYLENISKGEPIGVDLKDTSSCKSDLVIRDRKNQDVANWKVAVANMVLGVERSYANKAVSDFHLMISHMSLWLRVKSIIESSLHKKATIASIYRDVKQEGLITTSETTFRTHCQIGTRICALVCAASLYIIPMTACIHDFQQVIRTASVDILWNACLLIRDPSCDKSGNSMELIKSNLIPSLSYVAKNLNFTIKTYGLLPSINDCISSKDMSNYPEFKYALKDVITLPERSSIWDKIDEVLNPVLTPLEDLYETALTPFSEETPEAHVSLIEEIPLNISTVKLEEFTLHGLRKRKCPVDKKRLNDRFRKSLKYRIAWSLREREIVAEDIRRWAADDHEMLKKKLKQRSELKTDKKPYIEITRRLLKKGSLKLKTKDNRFIAGVLTEMPEYLKSTFLKFVQLSFDDDIVVCQNVNSENQNQSEQGESSRGESCHFELWFRYATSAKDFPTVKSSTKEHEDNDLCSKVHPSRIRPVGYKHKKTLNYRTLTIHSSEETLNNHRLHTLLKKNLEDAFLWYCNALKAFLPRYYKRLEVIHEQLPLNEHSCYYPFTGMVLNLSVSTFGHRDKKDKDLCMVIPFGKWEGGQLVLYELGLAFDLRHCDALIFRSNIITHFNLTYTGLRNAIILHSDKDIEKWPKQKRLFGDLVES